MLFFCPNAGNELNKLTKSDCSGKDTAMNPFTRFLMQWSSDAPLEQLVQRWDVLEALVIRVYRGGEATSADEATYQEVKKWLDSHYPQFESALSDYWQKSKVGGTVEHGDPFRYLFAPARAAEFVDNWPAMQHLPAAREALNQLVVASGSDQS